jgi:hypothetical protein
MDNIMRKLVLIVLVLVMLAPQVSALKGVGIVYGTVITNVNEGEHACFSYGVYNPWDEDIKVQLTTNGELAELNPVSENIDIPAGTMHDEAKPLEICFDIPRTYPISCPTDLESIMGKIIVTEWYPAGVEGTGSSTSVSAAAPLELIIQCDSEKGFQFDTRLFLIGGGIVGILVALYLIKSFFKTHKVIRK